MALTKKRTLKYVLLPELLPRIGSLFGKGFYHIAFLIAVIYAAVRLLPANHPYLNQKNLGRFGIRHVISEASNNLVLSRKNIDQIFIFFTVLIGLIILIMQIVLMGFAFAAQPVYAGIANFPDWFTLNTGNPLYPFDETNDIALMTLDRVFGVQGIFNSCISTAATCIDHLGDDVYKSGVYPYPMHLALHQLFYMYSLGIGVISLMIILYHVITIIGETAVSGTPFGQRFNRAWAPVRFILFFALLAPLNIGGNNEGLNGAQLITLWTAKFGSNFATNAWGVFNTTTTRTYYQPEELIAVPKAPQFGNMAQFWTIANACVFGQKLQFNKDIFVYAVRENTTTLPGPVIPATVATAHPDAIRIIDPVAPSFTNLMQFTANSHINIVVGEQNPAYDNYKGQVKPICGEVTVPITAASWPLADVFDAGAARIGRQFYQVMITYAPLDQTSPALGLSIVNFYNDINGLASCIVRRQLAGVQNNQCDPVAPYTSYADLVDNHMGNVDIAMVDVIRWGMDAQINPTAIGYPDPYVLSDELVQRGWASAAIWYNRIAKLNGSMAAALYARPYVKTWPMVMEEVKDQQRTNSEGVMGAELFSPTLTATQDNPIERDVDLNNENYELAAAYYNLYKFWDENANVDNPDVMSQDNAVIDTINAIFGTSGLFDMRQPAPATMFNPHPGNTGVHPLALLSSLGRSMIEASITNLGVAVGSTIGGGVMNIMGGFATGKILANTASNFLGTVVSSTILIGFMLYYVLPFMPFVYFFFALGGWVKSIFEAMVAMPIWALAHLRIDGDGLPGPGASNGYFLLLEIFIRPILILVGLIASIVIFGALVQMLNAIFDLMVENIGGVNRANPNPATIGFYRGPIDELFYSIMYAVIVYMMGLSCFKLVDQVPNNILRWMGVSVSTFQDSAGDQVGGMTQGIYQKGNMTVGQISGFTKDNAGRVAGMIG